MVSCCQAGAGNQDKAPDLLIFPPYIKWLTINPAKSALNPGEIDFLKIIELGANGGGIIVFGGLLHLW
jgi:hypothetical protein